MSKTCGLTDRELDIWVAEHVMGWTTEGSHHPNPDEWEGWRDPEGQQGYCGVMAYAHYLDACAQAEVKIAEMKLIPDYIRILDHGYWDAKKNEPVDFQKSSCMATARQRCEAMYAIREKIEAAHLKVS